jgi:TonB family protein
VITSPVWSAGALPFGQTPKSLRGRHVDVTFWVRADGRVERTSVAPPIDDVEYLKYFQQVMQTFRFRPARDPSGAAVPGTVTMGFELPSK